MPPEQVIARLLTWASTDFRGSVGAALGSLAAGRAIPPTPEALALARHPRLKAYLLDPSSRDETWNRAMQKANPERVAEVAEILFGERPQPVSRYLTGPYADFVEH